VGHPRVFEYAQLSDKNSIFAKNTVPMKLIPLFLALIGLSSCAYFLKKDNTDVFARFITHADVKILDVRTPEEYAEGHLAGSILVDFKSETFEADAISALGETRQVAVYCRSGRRSAEAAKILGKHGFTVINLAGGIIAWHEAGFPVTTNDFKKPLILYYSQCGATEAVATELQKQTGADIERFDVTETYDGSFDETIARCMKERGEGFIPTLIPLKSELSGYDLIYLGYPVWFGTFAPPVQALLNSVSLEGKTIVPFCTFGSGGLTASTADLRSALPGNEVLTGFGARTVHAQNCAEDLNRFLIENGFKAGGIKPLPAYSEQTPVTPEETSIFDEACGDYLFPLGTPVTVGSRPADGGTDYLFTAESTGPDGSKTTVSIYVSTRKGRKAYFTLVDR